jgi:hypothetical protein
MGESRLTNILSQASSAEQQMMLLGAKLNETTSQMSDIQISLSDQYKSSLEDSIKTTEDSSKATMVITIVGATLSVAAAVASPMISSVGDRIDQIGTTMVQPTINTATAATNAAFTQKLASASADQAEYKATLQVGGGIASDGVDAVQSMLEHIGSMAGAMRSMITQETQAGSTSR